MVSELGIVDDISMNMNIDDHQDIQTPVETTVPCSVYLSQGYHND